MTLHRHTDTTTPTTTPSTPTSEGSLSDFQLSQIHDSRDPSSDESRDLLGVVYGSSDSLKPDIATYAHHPYDVPTRPLGFHSDDGDDDEDDDDEEEETRLDLTDGDDILDGGGFPSAKPPPPPPPPPLPPHLDVMSAVNAVTTSSAPPIAAGTGAVPLGLVVARHEMSGRPSLAQTPPPPPSLPSQRGGETAKVPTVSAQSGNFATVGGTGSPALPRPSVADFVRRLNLDAAKVSEPPQWDKATKETAIALNECQGNSLPDINSSRPLPFQELSGSLPLITRYKRLDDDDDFTDDQATSRDSPCTTDFTSEVTTCQISLENLDDGANKVIDSPIRTKRYRKKPIGLALAIDLDENDSDTKQETALIDSYQGPQNLYHERTPRRQSFVVLSLEDNDTSQGDSWDHSELEEDALETMKIEDKWKLKDIPRCPKTQPYRMESDGGDMAVINISEGEDDRKLLKCQEKNEYESDPTPYDVGKGSRVKSVLYDVREDAHDGKEGRVKKSSKDSGMIDEGHDNPAYIDDEQDAVSQDDNGQADQSPDRSPVEVSRRRSNPEIWPAGHRSEDIVRSHSYGNELNEVMNNLSGDQEEPTAVVLPPTLRKRSTSRGRPENIEGKENGILVENTPTTPKKEKVIVSFGPTFAYGAEDTATASIFQKLVGGGASHSKLTRSESSKSNLVGSKTGREEIFTRSTSNIWEGGSRTKGSGGSPHYGRPPQAPSSSSQKSIRLQQHLYRNSRRNMQAKLLRQLSDVYYDDHRYNNNDHHGGGSRHDHSHHHHHHHHHSRHNRDSSPSTPTTDHRGHGHHSHSHGHGHGHHHRSQSQKHSHKPKHEPLRRLNTYAHEDYHKYVQEHEHRYELARSHELLLLQSQQQGYGLGGQGGAGGLKPSSGGEAVRRISHYQQEEKGKTDVERWVGVHGDQPAEGAPSQPLLPSPGTPHIVVSPEDSNGINPGQGESETGLGAPGPNGPVFPNAQSTPAPPPTPANNIEENRSSRPDKLALNMTTLTLPDGRHPSLDGAFFKKTRRHSISEMHQRFGSQTNLQRSNSTNNIQRSNSRNSLAPSVLDWKQEGNDSLIACLSALYGKLLVVMGMAFPTAEVISHDIPVTFYNGFYLYLYIGSIIFLVYAYLFLLHAINIPTETLKSKFHSIRSLMTIPDLSMVLPTRITSKQEGNLASKDSRQSGCADLDKESDRVSINTGSYRTPKYTLTEGTNHGSMYLKMGAVLFGIGSMIYSGLEVGQYFELKSDENCADILLAISPAARMLFTFIQMYFIFLNSRVAISRHRIIARFGLMHMIGTNLCIWLNVLVQETKHEIINLTLGPGGHHGGDFDSHGGGHGSGGGGDHGAGDHGASGAGHHTDTTAVLGHDTDHHGHSVDNFTDHVLLNDTTSDHHTYEPHDIHQVANASHHIVRRGANQQALSIYECRRSDLMGELVDEASPFLFPCTIEYSLLCAGVLYVIWKNINKPEVACDGDSDISTYIARKARHHYSVDCAHANRGLFMGILVLVLTIISLILFFVLINNEAYKEVAILEANIIELSVYGVSSITVIIGMIQMRELEFIPEGDIELDNILLLIAQSGVYIYTSFTVIGGHFTMTDNLILPLLSSIVTLLQTTLQTIFVLDASRRCCYNQDQLQRKPGREMVTFLLVCNLAMWAINTFETSRADAHPTQLNFYGIWAWTIISHISMPLAIFYRFHVTVCLCEIWKRSYKLRHDY
ncbi:uncharacterized protein [Macrobrachium rosenbergii]|uniref:uncharacterized protein isoform X5 n=1 Tax=Macrobrachium rosenbergii TaxID=79674 RepID=UPI0034D7029A